MQHQYYCIAYQYISIKYLKQQTETLKVYLLLTLFY